MYIDVQTVNNVLNQEVNYWYEDCRHNIFFFKMIITKVQLPLLSI